jgi:hypothetical protein
MGLNYPPDLKDRIAKVLSEILSDKYDAKITLRFVPKDGVENEMNRRGKKREPA